MAEEQKIMTAQQAEEQAYRQHVEQTTPKYSLPARMAKAFLTGGLICVLGQFFLNYATNRIGIDQETAGSWCSLLLVLISVLLTGFKLYTKCVDWGGAGALVPITGFANAMASASMEFKTEGLIFGTSVKLFSVVGPVVVNGIVWSTVAGLLNLWITGM